MDPTVKAQHKKTTREARWSQKHAGHEKGTPWVVAQKGELVENTLSILEAGIGHKVVFFSFKHTNLFFF